VTLTNFSAPSPSRTTSWASSAANDVSSSRNLTYSSGVLSSEISLMPLAPLARATTVSLVLMSPSTEIELNERSTAYVRALWSDAGSTAASVAMTPSMVACGGPAGRRGGAGGPMLGWIMPAPLSMPTMRTSLPASWNVRVRSLGNVSVVMKARAQSLHALKLLASVAVLASMPWRIFGIGNSWPMTPVLMTSVPVPLLDDEADRNESSWSDMARASASPCVPVTALAHPLLTTSPRATPLPRASTSCETTTGAATNALRVKVPAAEQGRSEMMTARSSFARSFLTPQWRPVARKPCGNFVGVDDGSRVNRLALVWAGGPEGAGGLEPAAGAGATDDDELAAADGALLGAAAGGGVGGAAGLEAAEEDEKRRAAEGRRRAALRGVAALASPAMLAWRWSLHRRGVLRGARQPSDERPHLDPTLFALDRPLARSGCLELARNLLR